MASLLCLFFLSSLALIDHRHRQAFQSLFGPTFKSLPSRRRYTSSMPNHEGIGSMEASLERARANIRRAVRIQGYISQKEQSFIPRGEIYRNAYAFHQSYIEMEKRLKVWTYREGERPIYHDGPFSLMYSIEGHIIDELENSNSTFIAARPDQANVFFLPFSITNILRYVYRPFIASMIPLQTCTTDYVKLILNKHPYWNRSDGADHFMVACHDWGPYVSYGNPKLFKNFIRILCNANSSEGFHPDRDATLPELQIHDRRLSPPDEEEEPPPKRPILAFFAGGEHGHIRTLLLRHWKDKDEEVQVHEYLPKGVNYHATMRKARFCLCPSGAGDGRDDDDEEKGTMREMEEEAFGVVVVGWGGEGFGLVGEDILRRMVDGGLCGGGGGSGDGGWRYEVASPRIDESLYAGCVPVILSINFVLPLSDVLDWSKFSVSIPVERIPDIKTILQSITDEEYARLRSGVMQARKHFVLNRPAKSYDVIHMVLHSLWLRRLNVRLPY
ncbi:putative glycosyltransferase [Acorus calamus]|uniref:Glycosyltransferase n=1 Tax=Acorus calamus TaxID=4465 RepID=A0AAV9DGD7_ACOCL|nr:putative glycosyltransferase [Acorus calamus]